MALTREEREAFLAGPHVATLGVAAGPDRGPLLVPLWYSYEVGALPWILTGAESHKMRLIRAAGRFSLLVQRTEPTPRYVSVEGPVAEVAPGSLSLHREMAARYLSGDALDAFMARAETLLTDHVVVRMRPEHWLGADLGPGPE
ncbi:pyridoxamine 5'-phosphate oxidase family protein [Streptomyces sp. NPDC102406]|uniref:pyridoxamine 5'-phosphate oxidase family protein n=1 Tax=Streptomyces sp. NPDC102406 TaxID=3366171 RepID=UPI00382B1826